MAAPAVVISGQVLAELGGRLKPAKLGVFDCGDVAVLDADENGVLVLAARPIGAVAFSPPLGATHSISSWYVDVYNRVVLSGLTLQAQAAAWELVLLAGTDEQRQRCGAATGARASNDASATVEAFWAFLCTREAAAPAPTVRTSVAHGGGGGVDGGLSNIGNSCYMNAVRVAALSAPAPLQHVLGAH